MERSRGADILADNIVHRVDTDTVLKPWLITLALLAPVVLGTFIAYGNLYLDDGKYFHSDIGHYLAGTLVYGLFLLECGEISFLLYTIVRRNRNHLERDAAWMDALCTYAEEHRSGSSKMRATAAGCRGVISGPATALSMAAWVFEMLMLIVLGILLATTPPDSVNTYATKAVILLPPTLLVLLAQFVLTAGSVFGFPARHDKLQSDFTREFSTVASGFGLHVGTMDHEVRIRKVWPHIALTVLTLGLYLFIYIFISCKEMNHHLASQWAYEEDLLGRIIEFEGGTGIEPADSDTGKT